MLQLITPTGARPESWALCIKWMQRQTYRGPVKWVIVDDGPEAQTVPEIPNWDIQVIRRRPYWKEGQNTQHRNILLALHQIDRNHPLLVIEDDEHYRPEYLAEMAEGLKRYPIVGQLKAYKYNVRLMRHKTQSHPFASSLCATGMQGHAIDVFRQITEKKPKLVDLPLWLRCQRQGLRLDKQLVTA